MRILLAFALIAAVTAFPRPQPVQLGAAPEPEVVQYPLHAGVSLLPLIVPYDNALEMAPLDLAPQPDQVAQDFNSAYFHPLAYGAFDEVPADTINLFLPAIFADQPVVIAASPILFAVSSKVPENVAGEIAPIPVNFVETENEVISPSRAIFVENQEAVARVAEAEIVGEIAPSSAVFVEADNAEEIVPSPIILVEAENIRQIAPLAEAEIAEEIVPSPITFVEALDDKQIADLSEAAIAEEIAPNSAIFVTSQEAEEIAPLATAEIVEDIAPSSAIFVENQEAEEIVPSPIILAEAEIAEEIVPSPVTLVESAEVSENSKVAVNAEEIVPSPAMFVDDAAPLSAVNPEPLILRESVFAY